ncbi:MAG: septal ring lytic transglycosylase RlpA family protein [Actinomycetota bacterium]|nr:septal ring lytic transglycosylase RlpA family protein [Actinomycetota bacterium]
MFDVRRGGTKKRALALILLTGCLSLPTTVEAGRRARPIIMRAPDLVSYGETVRIAGEVERGRPGMKVYLKRRHVGYGRKIIRVKRLPRDRKIKFVLPDRTKSATYRLVLHAGEPNMRASNGARVEVKPRLTFGVDPNDVKARKEVELRGKLLPAVRGRTPRLQMRVKGEWELVKRVDAGDGKFKRWFVPDARGHRKMRVVFHGDKLNASATERERLWVYKRSEATWYGPGFYGNRTACGQTLRRRTWGVAHRTLPCGTDVHFLYKGRKVTVPVIDRGPYGEANWDLTYRTKERLHFEGRGIIGFILHDH